MGLMLFDGADTGHEAAISSARSGEMPSTVRSRQLAPLARVGAYIALAGMILGFIGILLPHPSQFNVTALVITQGSTILFAGYFLIFADRISLLSIRLAPPVGIIQATFAVIFSGDPTSAYTLLYLWPCIYAFYFLPRIDGFVNVVFMTLCYGVAIAVTDDQQLGFSNAAENLVHHFVLLAGTLVILGLMMHVLRTRVDRLWGRLIGAARTDLLTGLLNSTGVAEVVASEIDRARMNAHRVSVLAVNITGLRDFNAKFGLDVGDDLLREVGHLLDDSTRRIDVVARTGGTTFMVVLPETDENTAFLLAEQILSRMRRTHRERSIAVGAAIGVAAFPKHAADSDALIQVAQVAAEASQALGADRAVVYNQDLSSVAGGVDPSQSLKDSRTHLTTVLSLAEVLDLRDERFAAHSTNVARYCEMIGRELQVPDHRIERLHLAGLLHDIGKVGIPDSILDKPGPLSPSEWDVVRTHPNMAARILGARELTDVRTWILARHEQLDGHGYPSGLSAEEIPLESKILAVAESYDAITSERPYRPARSHEEAIAELGRYVGTQFDGAVVDAFVRALERAQAGAAV